MSGLAIEAATSHAEVAVCDLDGRLLAHEAEDVGHGHVRRLMPLVTRALARAGVGVHDLSWVAADLGPGSFTGVRVGLATAEALAMVAGGAVLGASSLAALALGSGSRRALVVPLIEGGKRDLYAGFFRADSRGTISLLAAPRVGSTAEILDAVREAHALIPETSVRFIGPGVPRERAALELAFPRGMTPEWRHAGLSAADLAAAVRSSQGPAAGLPAPRSGVHPLYVRPAQAEERVRRRALADEPIVVRPFTLEDVPPAAEIERQVFTDPWPESFFASELRTARMHARVAECRGRMVGYSMAWLGQGVGHLGNLAVVPDQRRRGVATRLLADLFGRARELAINSLTLEVRVANFEAQWLYRRHGFRLAGLRRRYYRDTGEDALVMEWRPTPSAVSSSLEAHP
jgi:tRNA threonylcarbamoyl adenosine modification protein YeaZ/ribosomal-protein-alanine acetyltransferase